MSQWISSAFLAALGCTRANIRIRDGLRRRTEQILRERDRQELIELSPNIAAALISAAQEEDREELAELWARLLASAMDPATRDSVSLSFIAAVKAMNPIDALVLRYANAQDFSAVHFGTAPQPITNRTTGFDNIASDLGRRRDEVEVSIRNLASLFFLRKCSRSAEHGT
jgi:hypothetical protein